MLLLLPSTPCCRRCAGQPAPHAGGGQRPCHRVSRRIRWGACSGQGPGAPYGGQAESVCMALYGCTSQACGVRRRAESPRLLVVHPVGAGFWHGQSKLPTNGIEPSGVKSRSSSAATCVRQMCYHIYPFCAAHCDHRQADSLTCTSIRSAVPRRCHIRVVRRERPDAVAYEPQAAAGGCRAGPVRGAAGEGRSWLRGTQQRPMTAAGFLVR